jgi:hypothetical protein
VATDPSEQLPIRCFLSYAHADDEEYEFVDALKKTLEHSCFSECGRRLEIFLDREAIGWGNDWRGEIADSLGNATVFIAMISLQYFDREPCREELQAFYSAASSLGATRLLLPLVMFGKSRITSESNDHLVRLVESLQHIDVQDAIVSGPGTREWRTTMLDVARRLVAAVEDAETNVQNRDSGANEHVLRDLYARVQAGLTDFAAQTKEFGRNTDDLITLLRANTERMYGGPREEARISAVVLAPEFEVIALDMQRAGGLMETTISAVDVTLRRYYSLAMDVGSEEEKRLAQREIDGLAEQSSAIRERMDGISRFFETIQPMEARNALVRKSLRPLRMGMNSLHVVFAIAESWSRIGRPQERG